MKKTQYFLILAFMMISQMLSAQNKFIEKVDGLLYSHGKPVSIHIRNGEIVDIVPLAEHDSSEKIYVSPDGVYSKINLESIYDYHKKNKYKVFDGWMARYTGEILLNIDDQHISEAEAWIKKAIEADSRNDMRWHLGRDYALYAELFKRKGDQLKARENLGKAIEIMKECSADGWVEKYEKELEPLL